jgi:hypothetical protein
MEPPQKKTKSMPADDTELPKDPLVVPTAPVLRLRSTLRAELISLFQHEKGPDGPMVAHPGLIRDPEKHKYDTGKYPLDITMDQYRKLWRTALDEGLAQARTADNFDLKWAWEIHPAVDMEKTEGRTDDDIALAVERTYIGAHRFVVVHC